MCRMVFATGEFEAASVIDGAILMAADRNERHEENATKVLRHADGWGLCYLNKNQLITFRSVKPIFEDSTIDQFRSLKTNLLVVHARHGTRGLNDPKNVHPFEYRDDQQQLVFFHNGTVRDRLTYDTRFEPKGETDSERLFYYLISENGKNITEIFLRKKLEQLRDFSSANFVLTTGSKTYIANWFTINPNYYTMKMFKSKNTLVVASEILPSFEKSGWQKLSNQFVASFNTMAQPN